MLLGKQIVEKARKIIRENPEYFEALVEFEKTKKLPKLNYKTRVNFTIDVNIFKRFRAYCRKKKLKMFSMIEQFIFPNIKEAWNIKK